MATNRKTTTTSKEVRTAIRKHVLECICFDGYDTLKTEDQASDKEKVLTLFDIHSKEYQHNNRLSQQQSFVEWCKGLPSSFNIEFYDYKIEETLKSFGIDTTAYKGNDNMFDFYLNLLYRELMFLSK
tara:strand:+ start:1123 stop:1503 length:381 start_codon:yes stop_codon:yes gene_type:complete